MVSEVQLKTRGSFRVAGVNGAIEGKEEGEASWFAVIPAERQPGSVKLHVLQAQTEVRLPEEPPRQVLHAKLQGALQSPEQQVAPSC